MAVQLQRRTVDTGFRHYIDGTWAEPRGGELVDIVDPSVGEVFARVPRAIPAEAEHAIEAARKAFDEGPWPRLAPKDRAKILRDFADALSRNRDRIVDVVVRQGGCTIRLARSVQVDFPIETMYRYAELAERSPIEKVSISGGPFPGGRGGVGHAVALREPAGVVSAITPFNYPFFLNVKKLGPALAAGCTVVLKPTEYTCLDAIEIARIADEETDLPKGVLNVLLGAKGDVGEMLSSHPAVDLVSFTGSTRTGARIMAAAAPTIKRVMLELGGKSANVVFADANLDAALAGDAGLVVQHCGQGCAQLTRLLVEESIRDEVLERMQARARSLVVGDPADEATDMGPLVSQAQWDRVMSYVESGVDEGATLLAGGRRPPAQPRGFFIEPTVFTDVRNDMRIAQEEIFGPVVAVETFRDEEEAVRIANDSPFGLNGAVWSGDLDRGLRVAGRMRAGTVSVNGPGAADWEFPFGGYKQSGIGREFGEWAYLEYTELKTLRYTAKS
jgi:aldehyde dehydrogenase (NAD+)